MKKLNLGFLYTKILMLFLFTSINQKIYAQGNACTNAENIPITQITAGTYCNMNADLNDAGFTDSGHGVSTCNTTTHDDYWWEFTATGVSGTINIEYSNLTANKDIVLEVFERGTAGSCTNASNGLNLLQCTGTNPDIDLIGRGTEALNVTVNTGTQYFIRVRKITDNVDIKGSLCVYLGSPNPDYDLIQNALPVTVGTCDFDFEINSLNINKETNGSEALAPNGTFSGSIESDAWIKLELTSDANLGINRKLGFSYISENKDAAIFVYYSASGSGNDLVLFDYDEVSPNTPDIQESHINATSTGEYEYIEFPILNNATPIPGDPEDAIFIRVVNTETGTMTGRACLYEVLGRNTCADAEAGPAIPQNSCNIPVNIPSYFNNTVGNFNNGCGNLATSHDIWLKYEIASAVGDLNIIYEGDGTAYFSIYNIGCGTVGNNNAMTCTTGSILTLSAVPAGTYLIRVGSTTPTRGEICIFEGQNTLSDSPTATSTISVGTSCDNPQNAVLLNTGTIFSGTDIAIVSCVPGDASTFDFNTLQDAWVELDLSTYTSGEVTVVYDNNNGSPINAVDVALEIRRVATSAATSNPENFVKLSTPVCANDVIGEGIERVTFNPASQGYPGTYDRFFVRISNLEFNSTTAAATPATTASTIFGKICAFEKALQQGDICTNAFPVIVGDCDFDFGWGPEFFNHPPVSSGGSQDACSPAPASTDEDGWFTFSAISTKTTIEFLEENSNVAIEVYRGNCGSLNKVTVETVGMTDFYCKTVTAGGLGELNLNTIVGENYFVRVINTSGTSTLDAKLCIYETVAQDICDDASLVTKTVGNCNIRFNILDIFENRGTGYNPAGGCSPLGTRGTFPCTISGGEELPSYAACDKIPPAGTGKDAYMRFIGDGDEVTIQYESLDMGDDPAIVIYTRILGLGPINCGVGLNGAGNNGNELICSDEIDNTMPHTESVTFKSEAGQLYIVRIVNKSSEAMRGLLCITEGTLSHNNNSTPLDINHVNNQGINVGVGECNRQMSIIGGNATNIFGMSGPSLTVKGGTQTAPTGYYGSATASSGSHNQAALDAYSAPIDEYLQVGYSIENFDVLLEGGSPQGDRYIAFIPTTTAVTIRYEGYQSNATETERPYVWLYTTTQTGPTFTFNSYVGPGAGVAWNQWGEALEVQYTGLVVGQRYALRMGEATWNNGASDLIGGTLSLEAVGTPPAPPNYTSCADASSNMLQNGITLGSDINNFNVSGNRYIRFKANSTNISAAYYSYTGGSATINILNANTCTPAAGVAVTAGSVGGRAEINATGLTSGNDYIVHISGGTFTAGRLVVYNTDEGAPADAWAVFTTQTGSLGYTPLPELITVQYDNDNSNFATEAHDVVLEVYKADAGNPPLGTPYVNDLSASPTLLTPTTNNTGATTTTSDQVVEGIESVTFDASATDETFYVRVIHKNASKGSLYGTICTFYGETIAGGPDCFRANTYEPLEGQWQDFNVDASWNFGTDNENSPFGTTMTDPPCVIPNDGRPRAPQTNPIRKEGWIKFTVPSDATYDRITVQYDNEGFNNGANPPNAAFAIYDPKQDPTIVNENCVGDVTTFDASGNPITVSGPSPCVECNTTSTNGLKLRDCTNNVWEGTESLTIEVRPGQTYWVRVMNVSTNTNTMQGRIRVYPFVDCTLGNNMVIDGDFENWRKIQAEVNDKINGGTEWYFGATDPTHIPDYDSNPNQNQGRYIHSNPEVVEIDYFQLFATEYGYLRDRRNTEYTSNRNRENQYKNLWDSRWELNPEGLYCVSQSPWSYKGDWSCYGVGYTGYGRNNNSSYCQSGGAGFGEDACENFGTGPTTYTDGDVSQKYNFNIANGQAQTHWPAPIPTSADANHLIVNGWWNRDGGQIQSGRVWCQTIEGLNGGNVEYFIFSAYFQNMIQINRNLETPQMRFTICDMVDPNTSDPVFTPVTDVATLPGTSTFPMSGSAPEGTLGRVAVHSPAPTGNRTSPSPAQPAYGAAMPCNVAGEDKDHRIKVLGSDFFINESPDQWMVVKCIYRKPQNVDKINICIENLSLTKNGNDFGIDQISFQQCQGISGLNDNFERLLRGDACEIADDADLIGLPLGINFLEFSGFYNGKNTLLSWTTIEEENTKKFIVQRSDNGEYFYDIGDVKAVGNTNNFQAYSFTDTKVPQEKEYVYYRLLVMGTNGDSRYSNVVRVEIPQFEQELKIVPNPASEGSNVAVSFTAPEGEGTLTVSDIRGNRLMSRNIELKSGLNNIEVNTAGLEAGIYIININQGNKRAAGKLVVY